MAKRRRKENEGMNAKLAGAGDGTIFVSTGSTCGIHNPVAT